MKLEFCKHCIQMTNHNIFSDGQMQCLKCGKGNKKTQKTSKSSKNEDTKK